MAKSGESSRAAAKGSQSYSGKRCLRGETLSQPDSGGLQTSFRVQQVHPCPGWLQASCADTSPELADQEEPGWPLTALIGQAARLPAPLSNPAVHVGLSSTPPSPHLPTLPLCAPLRLSRAPRCGHYSASAGRKVLILLNT